MRVARQSRFHRILGRVISRRRTIVQRRRGSSFQGTAEPALPGRQCRPLGGDAAGGAGGSKPSGLVPLPQHVLQIVYHVEGVFQL